MPTPAPGGRGAGRRAHLGTVAISFDVPGLFDERPRSLYPPGRPWVSIEKQDAAGTQLQVQLLNDAMAPTYPAGTWLAAHEVPLTDPLTPGVYLVRWDRARGGYVSYVGRLRAQLIRSEELLFEFDGPLPEPILCAVSRTGRQYRAGTGTVQLYRVYPPGESFQQPKLETFH